MRDYARLAKQIAQLQAKSELQFSLQAGFARVMHRLPDAGAKPATCLWAGKVHHPELELLSNFTPAGTWITRRRAGRLAFKEGLANAKC